MSTHRVIVPWCPTDDEEYEVRCLIRPGEPGRLHGPPEKCYPPEPPEVEFDAVLDATGRIRPDLLDRLEADPRQTDAVSESALMRLDDLYAWGEA